MQQKAMGLTEGDMEIGREGEKEKERGAIKREAVMQIV